MNHREPSNRSKPSPRLPVLLGILLISLVAGPAQAMDPFVWGGTPVHPACVHALAMLQGDAVPVTTAVSLEGCDASGRSRGKASYEGDFVAFEDDEILGGGSFGYRQVTQLENGIIGLAIRRVFPDGKERVSLAAVKRVQRAMIRNGKVIQVQQVELLGELWIPGMQPLSFRSVGNIVRFNTMTRDGKVEQRTVDFTRLGRLRN